MNLNDISDARRALAAVEAALELFSQSDWHWSNKWHGREIRGRGCDELNTATRLVDALAERGSLPAGHDCRGTLAAAKAEALDVSAARRHIHRAVSELRAAIAAMERIVRAETELSRRRLSSEARAMRTHHASRTRAERARRVCQRSAADEA